MRQQLLDITQKLSTIGLNRGSSGNVSVREGDGFLITPSGITAEVMTTDDMVWMSFAGQGIESVSQGLNKPSSEWRFHHDIYQARPEVNAIIHTHSLFASTLSTLRRDMPAFHYMIALAGGDSIRCAPYALFGSQALSNNALSALHNRKACLLANHGMIAIAENLTKAMAIAIEVETLCEQYLRALQVGALGTGGDTLCRCPQRGDGLRKCAHRGGKGGGRSSPSRWGTWRVGFGCARG